MLRKEKEITAGSEIDAIIHQCQVCRLAFAVNHEPYLVPLSFGYDGCCLYFHTTRGGKKIDCLQTNPYVCFEFEHHLRLISSAASPCAWGFGFETVIGYGHMTELDAMEDKIQGLHHIITHYAGDPKALEPQSLANLRIWRLDIESMTGKKSPAER